MGKYNEDFGQLLKGFSGKRAESWAFRQVLDSCKVWSDNGHYAWGLQPVVVLHCSALWWK